MKPYASWTSADIAQHIERLRRLDGTLGDAARGDVEAALADLETDMPKIHAAMEAAA